MSAVCQYTVANSGTPSNSFYVQVLLHPAEHRLVPDAAVVRAKHPVPLVRKDQGFGLDAVAPQHGEHLQALVDRHAEIELVGDDERRRLDVVGEQVRRPLQELLARLGRPRRSAELPLGEPQLLGRERHRLEVEHAVVGHRGLEPVGVTQDPVDGVAAVAGAGDAHAGRVGERQLRHLVHHRIDVGHHLAAPVARNLVDELLAEPGRPARIRRGDHPALSRPQRRIPPRRPGILPRALRSAVNQEDDGIFPRGIEVGGLDQPGTARWPRRRP